jgi:hypothetical protein
MTSLAWKKIMEGGNEKRTRGGLSLCNNTNRLEKSAVVVEWRQVQSLSDCKCPGSFLPL